MIGYDEMEMINYDIRSRPRYFIRKKINEPVFALLSIRRFPSFTCRFCSVFSLSSRRAKPPSSLSARSTFSFPPFFFFSPLSNRDSTKEGGKKRTFPRLVIKNKQKGIDVIDVRTEGLLQEDRLVPDLR